MKDDPTERKKQHVQKQGGMKGQREKEFILAAIYFPLLGRDTDGNQTGPTCDGYFIINR